MGAVKVGDHVRIVIEGPWVGGKGYRYGEQDPTETFTSHVGDMVTLEKIDPPVEIFGPGDVVKARSAKYTYAIGRDGYFDIYNGAWNPTRGGVAAEFTSEDYERVSVG